MDAVTIIGVAIALGAIVGGHILEGGAMHSIMQPTAAMIVCGGTIGAICVQFPGSHLKRALFAVKNMILPTRHDNGGTVRTIVALATKARREGLLALEKELTTIEDPFLRRALEMAIDGVQVKALRSALEIELSRTEEEGEVPAKVFEAAGGYAPTVGILGAVLGLIHVMENLSDPSKLGSGIAVAFVATVYGVGLANLLFLPTAGKLKARHHEHVVLMELIVEGVCALTEGEHPPLIERKLGAYVEERESGASAEEASMAAAAVGNA